LGNEEQNVFVFVNEGVREANILVRKIVRIHLGPLFVQSSFAQELTIERAIDGYFPLLAAAEGTDVTAHTGTISPRLASFANRTCHEFSITSRV
jgi:hypothetical protein